MARGASGGRRPPPRRPTGPPPPHVMCTPAELRDRQTHMELSEFECTPSTCALDPRRRRADPRLVAKKYRRSAAGGGAGSVSSAARGEARDVESLVETVDHLLGFLLPNQTAHDRAVVPPRSLSACVSFVDDRVRAVQVDLTTSLLSPTRTNEDWRQIRRIQSRLVRYGIFVSYLLRDLPSGKYEAKFGQTALRTAIDSYFAAWDATFGSGGLGSGRSGGGGARVPTREELQVRDELLSYEALMHVAEGLRKAEKALPTYGGEGTGAGGGGGSGPVLASYLSRGGSYAEDADAAVVAGGGSGIFRVDGEAVPDLVDETRAKDKGGQRKKNPSKWFTALEVAAAADRGNFIRVFRLLGDTAGADGCRWTVLARCCFAPAVNVVRIGLLRRYNKSFGKSEQVSGDDLARLLRLSSSDAAIRFCSDVGIPIKEGRVVMKAAPISITDPDVVERMTNPVRADEDAFVFGERLLESWSSCDEEKREAPRKAKSSSSLSAAAKPSSLAAAAKPSSSLAAAAVAAKKKKSSSLAAAASKKSSSLVAAVATAAPEDTDEDEWENAADNLNFERKERETSASSRVDRDGVVVPPGDFVWSVVVG